MILESLLIGCGCGSTAPVWTGLDEVHLDGAPVRIDLRALVADDRGEPTITVADDPDVVTELGEDGVLTLTPQPGWTGTTTLRVAAEDACGNVADGELVVHGGAPPTTTGTPSSCATVFRWAGGADADGVSIAGSWNDWEAGVDELAADPAGGWSLTLDLAPGVYAYKFVERRDTAFDPELAWACDPAAPLMVCDPGVAPSGVRFTQDCTLGANSCNSVIVVEACAPPKLHLDTIDVDRAGDTVSATFSAQRGSGGEVDRIEVFVDGAKVSDDGTLSGAAVPDGRHVVSAIAYDGAGNASERVSAPFWTDGFDWDRAVVYFAFVDRVFSGEASNDDPTGATGADYAGGDWKGLRERLPYLSDLGVSVLWISNPQDNAEGGWAGDCGLTYAGYHGYWPSRPLEAEGHFGTEDELADLVDAAHGLGMRVIMDWVGNHVHEDHPYAVDHPEWFHPPENCKDTVNGQSNFDRIPEECWFAPYLPDLDYGNPEPLVTMVEDAMVWTESYGFDGLRVDAVKHMSHAVVHNLEAEIDRRIEHPDAGLDEEFWTIGETFDGADRIAAYLGEDGLDGQFDFPLYWSLRSTFAYGQGDVINLLYAWDGSKAAFGDARMSTFLGNHDVNRFVTDAFEGGRDLCDGGGIATASAPSEGWPYESLRLGFTFLFTMPGIPLVYYGDELGIPGYGDPDNRQPLSRHVSDLGAVDGVDDLAGRTGDAQLATARHVRALAKARAAHPALSEGGWVEWWKEYDLVGYARASGSDHALVLLNRSGEARVLDNGLAFAGLPEGRYVDALTGEAFTSTGDRISVPVPARGSRVLLHE